MFFFFFKQKTAYEMRISDWSSDVCSSDLQSVNPTPKSTTEAGRRAADAPFAPHPHRHIHPRAHPLLALGWPDAGRSMKPNQEKIGRASCRERVCQYV